MARLKCKECGNTSDVGSLTTYGYAGLSGLKMGVGVTVPKWPLVTRVLAECPSCGKRTWLKVLRH
jgi:hypothetical protein